MTDKKVTIQTKEGQYEATLRVENTNNCPMQEKLGLTRYRISEPPKMMHNIPKYHKTKQIQNVKVLKFDISRPDPGRQLWNRRQESRRNYTQECVIETMEEIQRKETKTTKQRSRKRTITPDQIPQRTDMDTKNVALENRKRGCGQEKQTNKRQKL